MIVLTYIKLHQSAMRDIVLLVDHAIKKKLKKSKKKKKAASLNLLNKKCSSMERQLWGVAERRSVERQLGKSACALDLKVNEYLAQRSPKKRQPPSVRVQFLYSVQEKKSSSA